MSTIMIGPVRFDTESHKVESPGRTAHLTPNEARVLTFLAAHANQVWAVGELYKVAYGFDTDAGSRALVSATMRQLRQKIEPDPSNPIFLLTVPGVGWQLVL